MKTASGRSDFDMIDVLVDRETGESLDRTALRTDSFLQTLNFTDPENNNLETGEPEEETVGQRLSRRRIPFQIPRALQRQDEEGDSEDFGNGKNHDCSSFRVKHAARRVEPFGQTNPIMLCVPIIFYFRWVMSFLLCLEVFLHIWAHHKNKYLKNADVYFRSPFHSISSEFCALCQSENCMDRVGKLQAVRADKFLRQCNYMKRVVS